MVAATAKPSSWVKAVPRDAFYQRQMRRQAENGPADEYLHSPSVLATQPNGRANETLAELPAATGSYKRKFSKHTSDRMPSMSPRLPAVRDSPRRSLPGLPPVLPSPRLTPPKDTTPSRWTKDEARDAHYVRESRKTSMVPDVGHYNVKLSTLYSSIVKYPAFDPAMKHDRFASAGGHLARLAAVRF